jgi:hypothetical protein
LCGGCRATTKALTRGRSIPFPTLPVGATKFRAVPTTLLEEAAGAASAAARSELPRRWWSEGGPRTLRCTGRPQSRTARPAAAEATVLGSFVRMERLPVLSSYWRRGAAGSADERARSAETTTTPQIVMVAATLLPFAVPHLLLPQQKRLYPFENHPFGKRRLSPPPCCPFAKSLS